MDTATTTDTAPAPAPAPAAALAATPAAEAAPTAQTHPATAGQSAAAARPTADTAPDATPEAAPDTDTPGARTPLTIGAWGRTEQQDFRSRVRGTLLGSAIGDALGAPVAGLSLDGIRNTHGVEGLTEPAPAHGRRGTVTASTQLTLFTVDGLIRAHVRRDTGAWHPPTDIHRAYLRWAATQNDWGPDERRTDNGWLGQQEWLYARRGPDRACMTGFADTILGTLDQPKNPTARDAAATTRSAPFGLLVGWEPALVLQLAIECAVQSHGHPTAYLSAGAFAVIVHALTRGDTLDSAVHRALALLADRPGHQPVTDALRRALTAAAEPAAPSPRAVESLSPGDGRDAEDTLAVAVYCALTAEDVRHGLRLAVNHGGDSSATGALCGALLGALHGETALPAPWLTDLEGRATLLELADDFALEMTQGPALHGPAASAPGWLARYPRG
ncbi:ADP-ribosylglycohydrolase family protein [Streptomyces globosus]|uniref:ADP-ribosylglycohydrolase family protein n=1 Tax=Streptomyces globosus TaxID=68209 RepID=UPI001C1FEB45|nr:ADP-ribosylglycohydrolase family protein [Streptomyces globosus]